MPLSLYFLSMGTVSSNITRVECAWALGHIPYKYKAWLSVEFLPEGLLIGLSQSLSYQGLCVCVRAHVKSCSLRTTSRKRPVNHSTSTLSKKEKELAFCSCCIRQPSEEYRFSRGVWEVSSHQQHRINKADMEAAGHSWASNDTRC